MEVVSVADALHAVSLAIALAACAGLRAWLPLLAAGLLSRGEFLQLGPQFGFLSSNKALCLLGLATAIEMAGDKFPAVDHALDALGSVLRPVAGTVLASAVLGRVSDPLTAWVLGAAIGTPAALVPHAAKTGARLASSLLSAGLANPLISALEDAATLVFIALALIAPLLICALLLVATYFVVRRLARRRTVQPA